jgi:hypothetical protein
LCIYFSATLAERSTQNLREKKGVSRTFFRNAENDPILRNFLRRELTSRHDEDCYTFEGFAPSPDVIRSAYYYHYKRNRLVLKEETTWS